MLPGRQRGADCFGRGGAGDLDGLGAPQRSAEDEGALEKAEHLEGELASRKAGDSGMGEVRRSGKTGDEVFEYVKRTYVRDKR